MQAQNAHHHDPAHRDAALVVRSLNGDEDAFRELVEGHSRDLFRLAYRMTGSRENAEDVVQDAFLKAYKALNRFDAKSRFSTWLYRIAANSATDLLRRQQRQGRQRQSVEAEVDEAGDPFDRFESAEPGPMRLAVSAEIERRLERGLAQLTPLERTAFVLRHFEQQSIAEIGRVLGSRTNATKQAVFRAVRKLRQDLAPLVEEDHVRTA